MEKQTDKKDECCNEKQKCSTKNEAQQGSEDGALKHNANASSPAEVEESMAKGSEKKSEKKDDNKKVAQKPADYVVGDDDEHANEDIKDAGEDKFGIP